MDEDDARCRRSASTSGSASADTEEAARRARARRARAHRRVRAHVAARRVTDRHRLRQLRRGDGARAARPRRLRDGRDAVRGAPVGAVARPGPRGPRRRRGCCSTRCTPGSPRSRRRERPKFVLFGESLGAWTSQDPFVDRGTQGLVDTGIDHAIWIGTPHFSKWKEQVLFDGRAGRRPRRRAGVQRHRRVARARPRGAGQDPVRDDHAPRRRRRAVRARARDPGAGRGSGRRDTRPSAGAEGHALDADHHVLPGARRHEELGQRRARASSRRRATTTAPTCCRSSTPRSASTRPRSSSTRSPTWLEREELRAQRVDQGARRDGQEPGRDGRRAGAERPRRRRASTATSTSRRSCARSPRSSAPAAVPTSRCRSTSRPPARAPVDARDWNGTTTEVR